ncbi:MAG: hypothetical protein KJ077_31675 [Anaerolineae bacterium]|nr:hypothetical protein [Anaerolineae bacterium]
MPNSLKINLFLLILTLIVLSACGGSNRSDDIAPVGVGAGAAPAATPVPPATPLSETTTLTETAVTTPALTTPTSQAAAPAAAAAPVLSFKLSGGIVGFCDDLTLDAAGNYVLRRACAEPAEIGGALTPEDFASLNSWVQNLASFQLKSEDNPGGPDNMVMELVFTGQGSTQADEAQQQAILDWANSLLVRIRPQAVAPPPTPEPLVIGPEGLCPDIQRPAILVIDFERPGGVMMIDPTTQAACNFQLLQPPYGHIVTAAGNIYYAIYDLAAKTISVWQLTPAGQQTPLLFTAVNMEEFGPFNFTVSGDGSKIAWARTVINMESDPPTYRSDLWVANIDGSGQVTLLDQAEQEGSYVEPVRFSLDQNTLYYALQPDGLGGMVFSFTGRYNSLLAVPASGGESRLLFTCPEDQPICIGDISPDGSALAYVQPGQGVIVLGSDGQPIATVTPSLTGYIGSPIFGPTGNLAFVSATLVQSDEEAMPRPNPGAINLVAPPYTGEVKTILSDNTVTTAWEWLDETRLIYGAMDEAANIGTALVTLDGQPSNLSPNFALTVLR